MFKYYDQICASAGSKMGVTLHICQILVDLKTHQGKCKLYPIHFF